MNWKDFFYFSRRERQGLLILLTLIIGIILGKFLFERPQPIIADDSLALMPESTSVEASDVKIRMSELPIRNKHVNFSNVKYSTSVNSRAIPDEKVESPETRTYYVKEKIENISSNSERSSFPRSEKLQTGMTINLNQADSVMFCSIPGIGPVFSKRIVAYRNLLGGYYRLEQLQEVYGMYVELYEKILPFLEITTDSLRKIPVNTSSLERLRTHPYISFYQAKAILEIRKKLGKLENISKLELLEEFSNEDIERLKPYLDFLSDSIF
jgi:DNA uptake protein and related DNA-binding proteins